MGGAGASGGDSRGRGSGRGSGKGRGRQATGDRRLETFDAGVKSQPGGKSKWKFLLRQAGLKEQQEVEVEDRREGAVTGVGVLNYSSTTTTTATAATSEEWWGSYTKFYSGVLIKHCKKPRTHTYIHIYTHTYIHIHAHTHTNTLTYMHTLTCTLTQTISWRTGS